MMKKKNTTSVYDEIEAAKARRKTDLAEAKGKLADAEARKAKAAEEAKAALVNEREEDYKAAKAAETETSYEVDLLRQRVENLTKGVLFNATEKAELIKRVNESVEGVKADNLPKLATLLKDAAEVMEEVRQEMIREAQAKDIIKDAGVSMANYLGVQNVNAMSQALERLLKSELLARYI